MEYASRHLVAGDRPLRRDLRLLSWQVRRLVVEHGGREVWEIFRELRDLAERRGAGDRQTEAEMARRIGELPTDRLTTLVQASRLFFDLANLAEDRHRVRVLRRREADGRLGETIDRAAVGLREAGRSGDEVRSLFQKLRVEPVLTAHPTEAKRRSIRRTLRRLRRDLFLIDRPDMLPTERQTRLRRMQRDLAALWYTDPISPRKPTVLEELERTLFATRTLWRVGPRLMRKTRRALTGGKVHGQADREVDEAADDADVSPLRFGTWIGGDRDGNPYVTSDVTRQALETLRTTAVRLHLRECRATRERLTVAAPRCGLPESLRHAIDDARHHWPELQRRLDRLHPDEWLVQWFAVIDYRLRRSARLPASRRKTAGYRNARELAADVQLAHDALHEAGHHELTTGSLQRWRDRIDIFGLHLMRLDLRVNSADLTRTIAAIDRALGDPADYTRLDDAQRRDMLTARRAQWAGSLDLDALPDDAADLIRALGLYQRLHHTGADQALGQVVVSMTHQPADALAVVWLMNLAAHTHRFDHPAAIPVVPLFETIDDLHRADAMLDALLQDDRYRQHVERCGEHQTCMVGYSDSAKDGGYLASNRALYQTQERLTEVARRHGVTLTIFHGRGGALGRGGGPAAHAIESLPPQSVDARLRITEQGEIIAERYDDPGIAERHLEQLFWATLTVSGAPHVDVPDDAEALADRLADLSLDAYRNLTQSESFETYLRQCTALPLIETLPIGSRPSRRTPSGKLDDLRAIPFTFAWNQVRLPLNAFFGLGSAYEVLTPDEQQRAADLYERWPWFRVVIDNAELALARCDPAIARRYTPLADDPDAADQFWRRLRDEHDRSVNAVLAIKREDQLIADVPWLRRTIRVRNPYLDILNLTQVELMRRRAGQSPVPADLDHPLRQTVQAIAAGLRNTG